MDQTPAQDREDVARVLAGDVDAFEGIVRRWQGPLVTLAYRYCRHPGRAEELAQEAFVRAFRKLGQWRGDAAFSTWLFALAINVCRTEVRRRRLSEVALEMAPESGRASDVVERIATSEMNETVRRVVGTLPRKYRDAVVLYYFSGMDIA
jgi:RNA polymerase sigma-70 factor (ECF subfamily)